MMYMLCENGTTVLETNDIAEAQVKATALKLDKPEAVVSVVFVTEAGPQPFTFPAKVRPYVRALADLMMYANHQERGNWAGQSLRREENGVFGCAMDTIQAIVKEVCGEYVAEHFADYIDYGACGSAYEDVEEAVRDVIADVNEEADRRAEDAQYAREAEQNG
jgi:hypothetical protein